MFLIKNTNNSHVSTDTVNEFESVILDDPLVSAAHQVKRIIFRSVFFLYRLAKKGGFSTIPVTKSKYLNNPFRDSEHLFAVMMGLDEAKYKPFGFTTNHCRSIFLFDAWEKDYNNILAFVNKYKIDFVFVTASQTAKNLNKLWSKTKVFWIPEAIKMDEYQFKEYNEKKTDVLAIGRKYNEYHNKIKDELEKSGKKYLYEKVKGEIIFPSREEFIVGLADAKISVCVPSNITHPERAGNIETMTIRYLQSMASKCLVLGIAPKEMVDMFGYNPVVEINMEQPVKQIEEILANFNNYIPLIEKNYMNVVENHTWEKRWKQIKEIYNTISEN